MRAEVAEKSRTTSQSQHTEETNAHEARCAWAPNSKSNNFKLGAICNSTFNQSLATQYDGLPQCAITGIGNGFNHLKALGRFGAEALKDAASVVAADLQIGYEAITYPALADANSDRLSQKLHHLQAKYEPIVSTAKEGYNAVQRGLNDIGAQSNYDNAAYARLITDPAQHLGKAIDQFTAQSPGKQIEAIADQSTQCAALGLAEQALVGLASQSTTQIAARYDQLLAKMDAELIRSKAAGPSSPLELQPAGISSSCTRPDSNPDSTATAREHFNAMSGDRAFRGDHDPWAPKNSITGKAKSHINENGDITPPDPQGLFKDKPVDIVHHLCGSYYKYHKQFSPFTSLSETGEIIEKYGERYKITVDLKALKKAVDAGEVPGVVIIPHKEVLQMIDQSKCANFSKVLAKNYATRDKEVLIRGVIPQRFFTVEDTTK